MNKGPHRGPFSLAHPLSNQEAFFLSPLGWLRLRCEEGALVAVDYASVPPALSLPVGEPCLVQAIAWLEAYFSCRPLPVLPLLSPVGTSFQQSVWAELTHIPPGTTRTYGDLAHALGTSPRAVGGALRANPIPLLIPCHRVVAADGLGGYAGAGSEGIRRKRWLLRHEQVP
ncbi:MAG: methylated-DNA--[protein]-cysteine S-methyltransferase [Pseudomonadota bacterium]